MDPYVQDDEGSETIIIKHSQFQIKEVIILTILLKFEVDGHDCVGDYAIIIIVKILFWTMILNAPLPILHAIVIPIII